MLNELIKLVFMILTYKVGHNEDSNASLETPSVVLFTRCEGICNQSFQIPTVIGEI